MSSFSHPRRAKPAALPETGEDPVFADLVARGRARRPVRDDDWEDLDRLPGPHFQGNEVLEALLANRDEDR